MTRSRDRPRTAATERGRALVVVDRSAVSMKAHLETLLATTDAVERLASDPLGVARRYTRPDDLEIAALVASSLAFGQVATIRARVTRVLDALGDRPAQAARERTLAQHRRALRGFVHRVWRGDDVAWLIAGAGGVARADGSLGAAFVKGHDEARAVGASDGEQLRLALASFVDRLMGASGAPTPPPRGFRHLLPDPRAGSACKRLLLFLRWMIRPADGVDLGLWPVAPSVLLVPVDTHIHRIALNLRMTSRTDVSWRTAEEITAALRKLDPDDPVRFDFALCHFGISRQCPSRRDDARCGRCVLRPVCRHWSGPAVP